MCSCKKISYTKRDCLSQLNALQNCRHTKDTAPKRCYQCDRDETVWHLTSQEEKIEPEETPIKFTKKWETLLKLRDNDI